MTIHRYWTGELPKGAAWMRAAVLSVNPTETLTDWDDESLPDDVVAWLDRHAGDAAARDYWRHRANMVRLWAVHEHGGWWVDHDVIPLVAFRNLPQPLVAAHSGRVCNCVMGVAAGHPWLRAALDVIDAQGPSLRRSMDVSGERLLERLRREHGSDVTLRALPFDSHGRLTGGDPWAIHLYASGAAA